MVLKSLSNDVRHAVRALQRTFGFTLFVVMVLACGIGLTTALFSVADQVVFRPLAFRDAERLVAVHEILPQSATPRSPVNAVHFEEWRAAASSFEEMSLLFPASFTLTGTSEPEHIGGARVSASFFAMLGMPILHGRPFSRDEDVLGRDQVVILAYELWKRRFGADSTLIGRSIRLDGEPYTVVGVLGPDVEFPNLSHLYPMSIATQRAEIWKPIGLRPSERNPTAAFNFACVARLKPGVSPTQAQSELNMIQREIGSRIGNVQLNAEVAPLHRQITGDSRAGLTLLLAAAAVVSLVACVNIANLFLVRCVARRQEVAIRQAIGAGRLRLFCQFLAEGILLAAAGGVLGALLAPTLIHLILASAPVDLPRVAEAMLDGRAVLFGAALSAICAVVLAALPAWRATRVEPIAVLKAAPKGASLGSLGGRLGSLLLSVQTAASTTCIVVAGLLLASFTKVMDVDPGFSTGPIISGELRLPRTRYNAATASRFLLALKQAVEAIPGVVAVGISDRVPLSGEGGNSPIALEGEHVPWLERPVASLQLADGTYFGTLGIPLLAGRMFEELDQQRSPVAVLSASAARHLWRGQNPIGKRFRLGDDASPLIEIIGTVGDVRGVRLESNPRLSIYLPYWYVFVSQASLTVRTQSDSANVVPAIRDALHRLDPDLAVPTFRSIEEIIERSVRMRRFQMEIALLLATAAVAVACLGIYGTVSQSSKARCLEIGIRVALGATRADIIRMVLRRILMPVLIGVVAGLGAALALSPVLQGMLFGIAATDARLFILAAVVLGIVATTAAYFPAHRASRVSPLVVMRGDT